MDTSINRISEIINIIFYGQSLLVFYPLKLEARGRDPMQNTLYHFCKYILYIIIVSIFSILTCIEARGGYELLVPGVHAGEHPAANQK